MQGGKSYSVLLIDDHPIYCEGMVLALRRELHDVSVLTASDGHAALSLIGQTDIDLVLCDWRLPGEDGITVISRLIQADASIAMGLLGADLTPQIAKRAKSLGAVACLSKERGVAAMAEAVRQLLEGQSVFDVVPALSGDHGLTPHRIEILQMAARGLSNKEIAAQLEVTERTIKDHWSIIFSRLGANNRVSALREAHSLGLISFGG